MIRSITFLSLLVAVSPTAWSQAKIVAVGNAASFQSGLPDGGALATAYVSGLSGLTPGTYIAPSSQPLPNSLGGVQVRVNNALAPILAVAVPSDPSQPIQINFQVPLERNVTTLYNFFTDSALTVLSSAGFASITPLPDLSDWGSFFADANGYAVALHASDSSLVTKQHPAHPGESIIVFADDFYRTWPPPPIGILASPSSGFQVFTGGMLPRDPGYLYLQAYPQPPGICQGVPGTQGCGGVTNTPALQVTFQGLASTAVGVEEIHFIIPANQQPGDWPLFFNKGSCPDGSGSPGTCNTSGASSGPSVLLPVD